MRKCSTSSLARQTSQFSSLLDLLWPHIGHVWETHNVPASRGVLLQVLPVTETYPQLMGCTSSATGDGTGASDVIGAGTPSAQTLHAVSLLGFDSLHVGHLCDEQSGLPTDGDLLQVFPVIDVYTQCVDLTMP